MCFFGVYANTTPTVPPSLQGAQKRQLRAGQLASEDLRDDLRHETVELAGEMAGIDF